MFHADKPSAPQNLRVTEVYKDYVVISWDAPKQDGGSPIKGYTIERADAKRRNFTSAGTVDADTFSFKVTKLYEGSEYLFSVSAENAIGQSEPAMLQEPVKARLPFGKYRGYICTCTCSPLDEYNDGLF